MINHPLHVRETTREKVSERLQGIEKVVMPRCVRIQPRLPEEVFDAAAQGNQSILNSPEFSQLKPELQQLIRNALEELKKGQQAAPQQAAPQQQMSPSVPYGARQPAG